MDRRTFVAITGGALLGLSPNLWAQGQVTARRIGLLATITRADIEAFLAQLRPELEKLGWTDGRNISASWSRKRRATTTRACPRWQENSSPRGLT